MKQCSTITEVSGINSSVANRLIEIAVEYTDAAAVRHEQLSSLFGGDVFFIENQEDLNEMVRMVGNLPDIVNLRDGMVEIFFAVNNAGGPSFYAPEATFRGWVQTQVGKVAEQFKMTVYD